MKKKVIIWMNQREKKFHRRLLKGNITLMVIAVVYILPILPYIFLSEELLEKQPYCYAPAPSGFWFSCAMMVHQNHDTYFLCLFCIAIPVLIIGGKIMGPLSEYSSGLRYGSEGWSY